MIRVRRKTFRLLASITSRSCTVKGKEREKILTKKYVDFLSIRLSRFVCGDDDGDNAGDNDDADDAADGMMMMMMLLMLMLVRW